MQFSYTFKHVYITYISSQNCFPQRKRTKTNMPVFKTMSQTNCEYGKSASQSSQQRERDYRLGRQAAVCSSPDCLWYYATVVPFMRLQVFLWAAIYFSALNRKWVLTTLHNPRSVKSLTSPERQDSKNTRISLIFSTPPKQQMCFSLTFNVLQRARVVFRIKCVRIDRPLTCKKYNMSIYLVPHAGSILLVCNAAAAAYMILGG
jgi:hypothetical protein